MTPKKRVYYDSSKGVTISEFDNGLVLCAFLVPLNHPELGSGKMIQTSPIDKHDEATGIIETMNTVYVPV
jgi:hypothetical protein